MNILDTLIKTIRRALDFELNLIGDRNIDEILNNRQDRILIENTIEQLKKRDFQSKGIEITLSCGNKITLTI